MRIFAIIMLAGFVHSAHAAEPTHAKELIEQHRAIAAAHEAAAQCLASGKSEKICHEELSKACKTLPVIGALCGMRKHRH
ncbi:hypothetical protein ACFQUU_12700 [Herbaspirillum sp. GCM10030257]|uniref:hypothetical protein n=1 Tax=Herbaspirillum sp. GCM10030257 TaxID=3273393 RepID=UPI00361E92E9